MFGYRQGAKIFARTRQWAGIRDFTAQELQSAMTNRLVIAGGDLTTVQELMGHQHITRALCFAHTASNHQWSATATLQRVAKKVSPMFTTTVVPPICPRRQVIEQ
jgi:site-specific recombinase XerD